MNQKIVSKASKQKANWYFFSSLISTAFGVITGIIVVKITIGNYGELTNGVIRFVNQIFVYGLLIINSISVIFLVKMIQFYKENKWNHIFWLNNLIKKTFYTFTIIYTAIFLLVGLVIAYILSSKDINYWFVYSIYFALGCQPALSLILFRRYEMYYVAINKGYIVSLINLLIKMILFSYFLISTLTWTPELKTTVDSATGIHIKTFIVSDIRKYNIAIGLFIYNAYPVISGILLGFIYRNENFSQLDSIDITEKEKKTIKIEMKKTIKFSLLLGVSNLLVNSTDEFVMLILRNKQNYDYILKIISIYGIYITMILSLETLLAQYVSSKQTLMGLLKKGSNERRSYMKLVKRNTFVLASILFAVSIILIPTATNVLFNPTKNAFPYFNPYLIVPISTLFVFKWIYLPNYNIFQIDNRFKILSYLSFLEGLINIILSISLIYFLGIYWVIWASVISAIIKIVITDIIIYWKYRKTYILILVTLYSKKSIWTFIFFASGIIECALMYYYASYVAQLINIIITNKLILLTLITLSFIPIILIIHSKWKNSVKYR